MADGRDSLEVLREEMPASGSMPARIQTASSLSRLEAALSTQAGREPICTLHELFPYIVREMTMPYYKILSARLNANGESLEIKAAKQLGALPKDKIRDGKGRLNTGLLDLVALGLTPEEVALIKYQPIEMDASMKLHRAGVPSGEAPGDNSLSPKAMSARWDRTEGGKPFAELLGEKLQRHDASAKLGAGKRGSFITRAGRREMSANDGHGSPLWDAMESLPRRLMGRG